LQFNQIALTRERIQYNSIKERTLTRECIQCYARSWVHLVWKYPR